MKAIALPLLIVLAALIAPARASAAGALNQAGGVSRNPANFDGTPARREGDAVPAGNGTDKRTPEQIAKDEQVKADARLRGNLTAATPGPDTEIPTPKPSPWTAGNNIKDGIIGAAFGLLIGSLFGPIGMIVGVLAGAGLFYGLGVYKSMNAAKE